MIKAEHINFSYRPNEPVVKDVSFSIEKGEFVCMIGHNGSGKSTIAKLLTGLLPVDSGEISIDGTVLNEKTVNDLRQRIGIVFQNPDNQFVGVTVRDDIAFGLENRQIERTTMLDLIDKYSKLVKMENFLDYNPENLSGGEKQRVALAGVLATDPDIIIFDEATSMLDPKGVKEVNDVIKELKGHKTIIAITHNLDEAIYADRVIVLAEGRIVMNDVPKAVFMQKELLKSSSLDILESMKLIELIEKNPKLNHKKEIEELLWELSFQK